MPTATGAQDTRTGISRYRKSEPSVGAHGGRLEGVERLEQDLVAGDGLDAVDQVGRG